MVFIPSSLLKKIKQLGVLTLFNRLSGSDNLKFIISFFISQSRTVRIKCELRYKSSLNQIYPDKWSDFVNILKAIQEINLCWEGSPDDIIGLTSIINMALHKSPDTEPDSAWQKPCIYSCVKKT